MKLLRRQTAVNRAWREDRTKSHGTVTLLISTWRPTLLLLRGNLSLRQGAMLDRLHLLHSAVEANIATLNSKKIEFQDDSMPARMTKLADSSSARAIMCVQNARELLRFYYAAAPASCSVLRTAQPQCFTCPFLHWYRCLLRSNPAV